MMTKLMAAVLLLFVLACTGTVHSKRSLLEGATVASDKTASIFRSSFKFFRFRPMKTRVPEGDFEGPLNNGVQLAEFKCYLPDGSRIFAETTTDPDRNAPNRNFADHTNDDDTNTKWRDSELNPFVYEFPNAVVITSYSFVTANDRIQRDPVRWYIEGSDDGTNWEILDDRTNSDQEVPVERFTETQIFHIPADVDPTLAPGPTLDFDCDTFQGKKDFGGSANAALFVDLKTISDIGRGKCWDLCTETYGCNALTYFTASDGGNNARDCVLKTIDSSFNMPASNDATVTMRLCEKTPECGGVWQTDAAYSKAPFDTISGVAKKGACKTKCENQAKCQAFTFKPATGDCELIAIETQADGTKEELPLPTMSPGDYAFRFCPVKECGEWVTGFTYNGPSLSSFQSDRAGCKDRCLRDFQCGVATSWKNAQNQRMCTIFEDSRAGPAVPAAGIDSIICDIDEEEEEEGSLSEECHVLYNGRYPNNKNCNMNRLENTSSGETCVDQCRVEGYELCSFKPLENGKYSCRGFYLATDGGGNPLRPGACFVLGHGDHPGWTSVQICDAFVKPYGQCDGFDQNQPPAPFPAKKQCVNGFYCQKQNKYYSQCLPKLQ